MASSGVPNYPAGTVLHWSGIVDGKGKFFVILGHARANTLIALRITSQDHWLRSPPHRAAMVEIPQNVTTFLDRRSFVNCFDGAKRMTITEISHGIDDGAIEIKGRLGAHFLRKIRAVVDNDMLIMADIMDACAALDQALKGHKAGDD